MEVLSTGLIALVGLIYLGVAVDLFRNHNPGMALTFLGYALANVGLIVAMRQGMAGG